MPANKLEAFTIEVVNRKSIHGADYNPDQWLEIPEIWEQALAEAGELMEDGRINNATLVDYVANNSFVTTLNPDTRFTNNYYAEDMYLGLLGQWQDGVFEVVDADARRTADPWYPKPAWKKN